MPYQRVNEANLWYEESGTGPEAVVFAHGFLMDHGMFGEQASALEGDYRCIRYDHRGQGRSEVTRGGYDMDALANDAAALIRALGCAPCHFAGLSMGGFVGLRLALDHPELLRSLTLLDTSADPEPRSSRRQYTWLARAAAWFGFRPLVGRISRIMFGPTYMQDPGNIPQLDAWRRSLLAADRRGILRTVDGVLDREGVHGRLGEITLPTLIIVGDEDMATPLVRASRMHDGIAGSKLVVIPEAGHSSSVEQPGRVSSAMREFLAGLART